jgi:hypothetical protein
LEYFARVLGAPQRPFVAVLGGSKISDKIMVIENLLDQCDHLVIGGGMAFTFLKVAHGVKIGSSLFDAPGANHVAKILEKAKLRGVTIHLPHDHVIADQFDERARVGVTDDEAGIPGTLANKTLLLFCFAQHIIHFRSIYFSPQMVGWVWTLALHRVPIFQPSCRRLKLSCGMVRWACSRRVHSQPARCR